MVIEIRHSDIQKMILGMYSFIKERGETIDVNKRLRDLMENAREEKEEKEEKGEKKGGGIKKLRNEEETRFVRSGGGESYW